jgi:hypothetical protein
MDIGGGGGCVTCPRARTHDRATDRGEKWTGGSSSTRRRLRARESAVVRGMFHEAWVVGGLLVVDNNGL